MYKTLIYQIYALYQSIVCIGCFISRVSGQFIPHEPQVSVETAVKHSELPVLILQTGKLHTWLIYKDSLFHYNGRKGYSRICGYHKIVTILNIMDSDYSNSGQPVPYSKSFIA